MPLSFKTRFSGPFLRENPTSRIVGLGKDYFDCACFEQSHPGKKYHREVSFEMRRKNGMGTIQPVAAGEAQ
jgi:hypothetical protein